MNVTGAPKGPGSGAERGGGRLVVTGANGFLGRHLCDHFQARGWDVRGLVRDPSRYPFREPGVALYACDLPDRIDVSALRDADVLIHCAFTMRPTSPEVARRVNEDGSRRIRELAREAGIRRFVFISSTSAHDQAVSYYGRSKLAVERSLDPGDLALRAGLILGSGDDGLFHRLVQSLRRTGMAPVVDGGRQIMQTVYVADLCAAIEVALRAGLVGCHVFAEPEGMPFRDFLRLVATTSGVRCRVLPLPAAPLLLALRLAERAGIALPISSENVLGLKSLRFQASSPEIARLGVRARPAAEALARIFRGPHA